MGAAINERRKEGLSLDTPSAKSALALHITPMYGWRAARMGEGRALIRAESSLSHGADDAMEMAANATTSRNTPFIILLLILLVFGPK